MGWTPAGIDRLEDVAHADPRIRLLADTGQAAAGFAALSEPAASAIARRVLAMSAVIHLSDGGSGLSAAGHAQLAGEAQDLLAAGQPLEVAFEWTGALRTAPACLSRYHAACAWWHALSPGSEGNGRRGMNPAPSIIITDYPRWPSPYFEQLEGALPLGFGLAFTPRLAGIPRAEGSGVINLHRLSRLYQGADGRPCPERAGALLAELDDLRRGGWQLAWTVHNLFPIRAHGPDLVDESVGRAVLARADAVIAHTSADAAALRAMRGRGPLVVAGSAGLDAIARQPAITGPAADSVPSRRAGRAACPGEPGRVQGPAVAGAHVPRFDGHIETGGGRPPG